MAALLEIRGLCKSFGALLVTDQVSLTVEPGEIHAIIGPNGAGKSCLIGEITGELTPDAGEVWFAGQRIDSLAVDARARAGIARAYQVPSFFASMSTEANATVPTIARAGSGFKFWRRAADDMLLAAPSQEVLDRVGLGGRSKSPSRLLAHGEKRQLELAMAFATRPKLLLLDEPLAGLGGVDSERMIELLAGLKGEYAILLVEHDMDAVFALADRISVLVSGRIIASGSPDAIRGNPEVRSAYLGDEVH